MMNGDMFDKQRTSRSETKRSLGSPQILSSNEANTILVAQLVSTGNEMHLGSLHADSDTVIALVSLEMSLQTRPREAIDLEESFTTK